MTTPPEQGTSKSEIYAALPCLEVGASREILLLTAPKMAARSSMLGLPLGESMPVQALLVSLYVSSADARFHQIPTNPAETSHSSKSAEIAVSDDVCRANFDRKLSVAAMTYWTDFK